MAANAAVSFAVDDTLKSAFDEHCSTAVIGDNIAGVLKVSIQDETFVLIERLQSSDKNSINLATLRDLLNSEGPTIPCYLLMCFAADNWILAAFVPDAAPIRVKMLLSSGRDALKRALGSGRFGRDMHWSSIEEVALPDATEDELRNHSVMTEIEKLSVEDAKLTAMEAAGDKLSSAALAFPMEKQASISLQNFSNGGIDVIVLAIADETIMYQWSQAQAFPDNLSTLLPADSPCYCLYRWKHTHADEEAAAVIFIYCCPEESPVRAKMLHASCKATTISGLTASGLTISKIAEVTSNTEVDEALLRSLLYPVTEEKAIVSKPAPRGGRKLTKRRDG
mmetsp:Transcript_2519/g.4267  ORF Transcript_2519/g.4267 Transcript_2519/m.4267 type:complete len:337 (+) Transcript_2519:34-1044(+)|eukprot:CAMPEP_0119318218 /NCGR_PEP_ID=MMETSP1333-20130426/45784_1 /TAXON_ID=418940 /ORGANISM="Scyphosphaera apsteinii, Strain RCC1455" /LENGTH=336 /DNA_ID=CAMNT_0007324351 /DNA_START=8 /DNA_END=1018 /DNA_ORIENTATION=-